MRLWIPVAALLTGLLCGASASERPVYLNPTDVVAKGSRAYVALSGVNAIAVVDLDSGRLSTQWKLSLPPTGLVLQNGILAATMGDTDGAVALIDTATGSVLKSFPAGFSPVSPVFIDESTLAVCNRFTHQVSFYKLPEGRRIGTVPVTREPVCAVAVNSYLYVGCMLPAQPATDEQVATTIEVIDTTRQKTISKILLPNGSTSLKHLAVSPDGKLVAATHVLAHHQVPTTQLENGWMNANALTLISTESNQWLTTILLDDVRQGAANPEGIAFTPDGKFLAVVHQGTREISRIPVAPLMDFIKNYKSNSDLAYGEGLKHELKTMQQAGRTRIPLPGEGPRALTILGSRALVCETFSGTLAVVDLNIESIQKMNIQQIKLGEEPPPDQARLGEIRFHDARLCFQSWQSCVSCHPGARTDALNWDLLNDGIGNPKQTKSMLLSHRTPPVMSLGIRDTAETAVRSGIRYIQYADVNEEDAAAIDTYLQTLEPLPSPFLVGGKLSEKAVQGKKVFEQAGCAQCHPAPLFTDLTSYHIGYSTGMDLGKSFDTPTLVELWRTAPYLYDGRAVTLKEALFIHIPETKNISDEKMDELVEYLNSL